MKNVSRRLYFVSLVAFSINLFAQKEYRDMKLWYEKPATRFEEALPLGNGRIGVMVYGDVNHGIPE